MPDGSYEPRICAHQFYSAHAKSQKLGSSSVLSLSTIRYEEQVYAGKRATKNFEHRLDMSSTIAATRSRLRLSQHASNVWNLRLLSQARSYSEQHAVGNRVHMRPKRAHSFAIQSLTPISSRQFDNFAIYLHLHRISSLAGTH